MIPWLVYGSGDAGTRLVLDYLSAIKVPHVFRDIRCRKEERANLRFLLSRNIRHVPAIFSVRGEFLGDADDMPLPPSDAGVPQDVA